MAILHLSVRKTRSLIKVLSAAMLFVIGMIALVLGAGPKVNPILGDGDGTFTLDVAHADTPQACGGGAWSCDWSCAGCSSCGDGCGDGGSSGDGP